MRSAIVGCGAIAQVHADCMKEIKNCEIVAFADCKLERAEGMASRYGGKAYSSLEEIINQEKIEVLHICTPHYLHVPMAIQALTRDIHVFCEKPPVISYEQYKALKEISIDKQLGFCFQNRYNPSIVRVKEMLAAGEAGKILGARGMLTWMRDRRYYEESDWRGRLAKEGGGVLINQSIHTMDLLQYLIDEPPVSIHAVTTNHHLQGVIEEEDTISALIQYANAKAIFYASSAYTSNPDPLIELDCENMRIRVEGVQVVIYLPDGRVINPQIQRREGYGKNYWGAGHLNCISDYYSSIESHQPCPLNLREVDATIQLMLGAYESAQTGKVIEIGIK